MGPDWIVTAPCVWWVGGGERTTRLCVLRFDSLIYYFFRFFCTWGPGTRPMISLPLSVDVVGSAANYAAVQFGAAAQRGGNRLKMIHSSILCFVRWSATNKRSRMDGCRIVCRLQQAGSTPSLRSSGQHQPRPVSWVRSQPTALTDTGPGVSEIRPHHLYHITSHQSIGVGTAQQHRCSRTGNRYMSIHPHSSIRVGVLIDR